MSPPISTRRAGSDMNVQSIIPVFDPAGPYAGSITTLSWVLIAMAAGVFAIVLAALWIALFGSARLKARLGGPVLVWAGGIVFPVVVLTLLLVYGLSLTRNLTAPVPEGAMRVRITGEMWWWRVAYLDRQGRATMTDANELHIPTGQPVLLEPIYKVDLVLPNEFTSKVQRLVSGRRGQILGFDAKPDRDGWDEVTVQLPQSEMHDLIIELRSMTRGVGTFDWQFDHLQELSGKDADTVVSQREAALAN